MFITRTHLCSSVILMGTRTPSTLHDLDLRPVTISGHQSWATENMPHLVLFLQGVGTVPRQLYVTFLICKRHSLIAEVLPLTLVMLIIMLHNHKLKTLVTWFRYGCHKNRIQITHLDIRFNWSTAKTESLRFCFLHFSQKGWATQYTLWERARNSCLMRFVSTGIMWLIQPKNQPDEQDEKMMNEAGGKKSSFFQPPTHVV